MNIKRIIREELEGFKDSTEEDWDWGAEISIEEVITDITSELQSRMVGERWENEGIEFTPSNLPSHLTNQGVIGSIFHYNHNPMDDYQGQYDIILGTDGFYVFLKENRKIVDRETFHTVEEMMEWVFEGIMMGGEDNKYSHLSDDDDWDDEESEW